MTWQPKPPTSTPPLQETHEKQYSHHLLEIGCGMINIGATPWLDDQNIGQYKNADITLIDRRDPEQMEDILKGARKNFGSNFLGSIKYQKMRAEELRLPNGSMDEIFMSNVLGQGTTQPINKIIGECARVLKTNGELIILETLTPHEVLANLLNRSLYSVMQEVDPYNLGPLLQELAAKFSHLDLEVKKIEVPYSMDRNFSNSAYIKKFSGRIMSESTFALVLRKTLTS